MKHAVHFVREAEDDLVHIHRYIAEMDSPARADYVFDAIVEACRGLATLPNRGHIPPELQRIGVTDFREVHWRPYRIIYEVVDDEVHVHAVLDGRRNLQDLLAERLYR